MSYLVLARKARPQTFASIIGQEHITQALANAIVWNRVPHALLFTGPRGVGKTTSARVLARALNCVGRTLPETRTNGPSEVSVADIEPCGECVNCKEIARSSSVAVWEIDGASNNSVDNVRELIDSLRALPPPGSRYKIYIIDEVHMLTVSAFNALLKSLEEPPPNTIFIFATTEPHKIPETVISRCQKHDFRRIPLGVIKENLLALAKSEELQAEEEVFEFIALKARGGLRDAQSMLDRLISFCGKTLDLKSAHSLFGVVDSEFYFELSAAVLRKDISSCLNLLDRAFTQSLDIRSFIGDFITQFRNLLLVSLAQTAERQARSALEEQRLLDMLEVSKKDFSELSKQAATQNSHTLNRLFDFAAEIAEKAGTSNYPRFVFEAGISKMATLSDLKPLGEILAELKAGLRTGSNTQLPQRPSTIPQPALSQTSVSSNSLAVNVSVPPPSSTAHFSRSEFNPSWQDLISFIKSRNELLLSAFLSRVTPIHFQEGKLELEAGTFDINSLSDSGTLSNFKQLLSSYSGIPSWEITFKEHQRVQPANAANPPGNSNNPGNRASLAPRGAQRSTAIPGSLQAQEEEAARQRHIKLENEAKTDPLVQATLSLFEGSKIEKISVNEKKQRGT